MRTEKVASCYNTAQGCQQRSGIYRVPVGVCASSSCTCYALLLMKLRAVALHSDPQQITAEGKADLYKELAHHVKAAQNFPAGWLALLQL